MTLTLIQYWIGAYSVLSLFTGWVHQWKMGVSLKMAFHLTNCLFFLFCLGVGIYEDTKTHFTKPKELTAHVAETPQIRTQ